MNWIDLAAISPKELRNSAMMGQRARIGARYLSRIVDHD